MRRPARWSLCGIGLLTAITLLWTPARAQQAAAVTRDDIIGKLNHLETAPTIDLPTLRKEVLERSRSRSRTEPPPQKRPPIAPDLNDLASASLDIRFDVDTPIVLPESYQTVGRIADAMTHASLLPYSFLIVGHSEATGRREANAILSQRRADAIREILVNAFKIAPKRVHALGLGEEQLRDPSRPTAPVNGQLQIITVGKAP